MTFLQSLILLAFLFAVLERLLPWRDRQRPLRPGVGADLFYLFLNGHLVGLLVGTVSHYFLFLIDTWQEGLGWSLVIPVGLVADWGFWPQFLVVFVVLDFLQWGIHNLLHRIPFLWELHKTHHSIVTMDWLGHMRFHWAEGLVYRCLLYLPLTLLDVRPEVLFWNGLISLAIGFFNHSNLRIDIGPLGYLLNNPRMHLWHHTHPECGPALCNFGLSLSLWDWLFGTAYQPSGHFPERIGLAQEDRFPESLLEQLIYPVRIKRRPPA